MMKFCYIAESGPPDIPGTSSHYVLCGISIPIDKWKFCDKRISKLKDKYGLIGSEIHTGWILRPYKEQNVIADFEALSYADRRAAVMSERAARIYALQRSGRVSLYRQTKKNNQKTEPYIHLTRSERTVFIQEIADEIGSWSFASIIAESIDKTYFNPAKAKVTIDEMALEQLVSRFEKHLKNRDKDGQKVYGALIHDNNLTVAKRHTELMQQFHKKGTLWTKINHIIETPLFVNSELTSMVQIADLCSYILRRYNENGETDLLDRIKPRFDAFRGKIVGVRHYAKDDCTCSFCGYKRSSTAIGPAKRPVK